jgi:colanic acid/amylovoran biosynthesis glycosyltransferase
MSALTARATRSSGRASRSVRLSMANGDPRSGGLRTRPTVSVIVPFLGTAEEAEAMLRALSLLSTAAGDELIIADNTPPGVVRGVAPKDVLVVAAPEEQSAYYPRNVAAERAANEWLLFTDADCIPEPDLLDAYFADEVPARCGAMAGEVEADGDDLLSRYAASRGLLSPRSLLTHPYRPAAATANLLVRRDAWRSLGGFLEGVQSDSDTDFCWRLQDAGWTLEHRPRAIVRHVHRETLPALAKQAAGYGAGMAWLTRRYPGSSAAPALLPALARCAAGVVVWTLTGRFERAAFKAIDAVVIGAGGFGRAFWSNRAPLRYAGEPPAAGITILCDAFPRLSETFVVEEARALERLGPGIRIEAEARPSRPALGATRGLTVNYREDDTTLDRLRCAAWLVARHPVRSARVALRARTWRRGGDRVTRLASVALVARRVAVNRDRHLHAHFALTAALDAMRLHLLLGVPYSVTAHAHDIYAEPANLAEKFERAAFSTTVCDYNVRHLRELLSPGAAARLHVVAMGVDGERFKRGAPLPGGRTVVGVGRLVEQKGFADLIDAVGDLEAVAPVERLMLVGDGPLREELAARAADRGLEGKVEFLGSREPDELPAILEGGDLLAMPSVVAADGTRDGIPVVVREAMAMELMTVGTSEVGLPEVIHDDWGKLVPARDPAALAEAIRALLDLPLERRAQMGADARSFVLAQADPDREARKLADLVELGPDSGSDHGVPVAHGGAPDGPDLDEVVHEQIRG